MLLVPSLGAAEPLPTNKDRRHTRDQIVAAKTGVLIVLGRQSVIGEADNPLNKWYVSDLRSATITAFLEADTKACEEAIRANRDVPNNLLLLRGCLTADVP